MDGFVRARVHLALRRGMDFKMFSYDEENTFGAELATAKEVSPNKWVFNSKFYATVSSDDVVSFIDAMFGEDIVVKLDSTTSKRCGVGSKYR